MKEKKKASMESVTKSERLATLSSCCGVLGETALTDGALIILFAGILGASEMLSMITTSVLPLVNGLCILPMGLLAMGFGHRRVILVACALASLAFFAAVSSPFWGSAGANVLIVSILAFSFSLSGFIAGWFPMLNTFLLPERRTLFFSRMRFWHQLSATGFMFMVSMFVGKESSVGTLQMALLAAAVIFMGRGVSLAFIPARATTGTGRLAYGKAMAASFANRNLTVFSIYLFLVNLGSYCMAPLTMLYLKNRLNAPDNVTVLCSTAALCGMLLGYAVVRPMLKHLGTIRTLGVCHLAFVVLGLSIVVIPGGGILGYAGIGTALFLFSCSIASVAIASSAEMMRLSSHNNKVMDLAYCGAFNYGGYGLSRLGASLLLGGGVFSFRSFSPHQAVIVACVILLILALPLLKALDKGSAEA